MKCLTDEDYDTPVLSIWHAQIMSQLVKMAIVNETTQLLNVFATTDLHLSYPKVMTILSITHGSEIEHLYHAPSPRTFFE